MMRAVTRWASIAAILCLLVGLAACASDDDDSGGGSSDIAPSDDDTDNAGDDTDNDPGGGVGIDDDADDDFDDDNADDDADFPGANAEDWPYSDPWEPGPYRVGVKTFYLEDPDRFEVWGLRNRFLPLEVWYPAAPTGGEPNTIPMMVGELPDWGLPLLELIYEDKLPELWGAVTGAYRDAPMLDTDKRFPVVFFSHGLTAIRFQNYTLCEYLASHGFVVVAPDHYGNAIFVNIPDGPVIFFDPLTTVSSYITRIQDVRFVYDKLKEWNAGGEPFFDHRLNLNAFGLAGHSYGALTSLLAGPRFDFIDAIAPLNPVWIGLFPKDYAKPIYMVQGTLDGLAGGMFDSNNTARELFDKAETGRKVHIQMAEAGHYSVTDACLLLPPSFVSPITGCNGDMIDVDLANDINDGYMTAFMKAALLGDDRYENDLRINRFPADIELTSEWR